MSTAASAIKGYAYITAWCIISAFSMILTGEANQSIHPVVICFFSFSVATIFFLLINSSKLGLICDKLREPQQIRNALWLNATTLFSWVFLVYPLKYVQPTAVITMVLGVNPIGTLLINHFFFPHIEQTRGNALVALGIFISVSYIAFLGLRGISVVENSTRTEVVISIACCVVAGIATAGNNVFIKDLFSGGFEPKEILSFRFFLTIVITGIAILVGNLPVHLDQVFVLKIGLTTVFLLVAPLMLIQLSLRELDPMRVAIISPIMPLLVAAFQMTESKTNLSGYTIFGTVVIWLLVLVGIYTSRQAATATLVRLK